MDYLEQIRREMKHIRPHREEDDEWYNEGVALLRSGEPAKAETKFKELVASQPEHHDGFEGLALTYQRLGRKDEALFFINAAIERAKVFLAKDTLDAEVIDELEDERRAIQDMG